MHVRHSSPIAGGVPSRSRSALVTTLQRCITAPAMAAPAQRLLVDVHTHVYLPRYLSFLRARSAVPRVFTRTTPDGASEERLLILDAEPSGGRPMGPQVFLLVLLV